MVTELTAEQRRETNRFDMRGGPWDGCMVRLFRPDWDVFDFPEFKGMYVRPHDVDPAMRPKSAPNKGRTNVPHMVWEDYS